MDFETESKNGGDGVGSNLREKIAELEGRLREERECSAMLRSESELAKYSAIQEVDRYKRECSSLRENVARLEEDCSIYRERGLRDQEKIRILMEEIETKVTEFDEKFVELKVKNRDLEFGKMRVHDEVQKWKNKYGEVEAHALRLVDKNLRLDETDKKLRELKKKFGDLERCKRTTEDEVLEWKEKYEELEARSLRIADKNSHGIETWRKENELKEKLLELETENGYLECAKKKMEDEFLELKKNYGELKKCSMKLLDDNSRLVQIEMKGKGAKEKNVALETENRDRWSAKTMAENEKTYKTAEGSTEGNWSRLKIEVGSKPREGTSVMPVMDTDEERIKRTADPMQRTEEGLLLTPGIRRKRTFLAVDNVNGNVESGHVSDDDEDWIPLIQRKRIMEAARGAKKASNFSSNHFSGCLAPSKTPSASSKPSERGKITITVRKQ